MIKCLITVIMLLTVSVASSGEDCAWNSVLVPTEGAPDLPDGSPRISDSGCFDTSQLSAVWLESDSCKCVMDIRIVGRFVPCDPDGCDVYRFTYCVSAGSAGGLVPSVGDMSFGDATPSSPPPLLFFEDTLVVDCGEDATFRFSAGCDCLRLEMVPGPDETTLVEEYVTVCTSTDTLSSFVASCDQECVRDNIPDAILVDHSDPWGW